MNKIIITAFLVTIFSCNVAAQRNQIFSERIKTLQVMVDDNWMDIPVMKLHSDSKIYIFFDDMTHTYHRYTYQIEHCEADWTKSEEIFESDYLNGFNGNIIEDEPEQSLNTTVLYNNYCITFPNDNCSPKISGNYRLTVYDEDDDNKKILSVCFMIIEPKMSVSVTVDSNTDIDINTSHQQIDLNVSYNSVRVTDPDKQIYTVVMQNGRWDNAACGVKPNYKQRDKLTWTHNRNYIFDGGNEYCKFEMLDAHRLTLNIDYRRQIQDLYHTFLFPIEEKRHYVYDEDADGAFLIRNGDEINSRECDYEFVHYRIFSPFQAPGMVYLNGAWTNDQFTDEYKMQYNLKDQCYEAVILQKQGYYNYQALYIDSHGNAKPLPSQGNFYETRNHYQALVYYKGDADRTWKLVGYQNVQYR